MKDLGRSLLPEPEVTFKVANGVEVELTIDVEGDDVAQFAASLSGQYVNELRELPDPVQTFVDAANYRMFASPTARLQDSSAKVLERLVDLASSRLRWRVHLRNVDKGAYLVLMNILRSRILSRIAMTSGPANPLQADFLQLECLAYPKARSVTGFSVSERLPDRRTRDRHCQLVFAQEPDDRTSGLVFDAIDQWTWLLMLGGYPTEEMHPAQSGAAPDPAFMLDPLTIEQAFPELFLCDDACYVPLINLSQVVHDSFCPLELVIVC